MRFSAARFGAACEYAQLNRQTGGRGRGDRNPVCYGSCVCKARPCADTSLEDRSIAAFRFIHTADIHLDSPLKSLALRDPDLAVLIGSATRAAFSTIIDLCLDEQVDALIIAGDLYDGAQTSMKTARFLAGELGRLSTAGIPAFIIRGNHDAMSKVTKELVLPGSVKLFGARAETHMIERGAGAKPVAVHGLSFANPTAPESLVPRYKPAIADAINIGILHTSLGGAPGHDAYAPCSPADLEGLDYDYWALGHIHSRQVITGRSTIVMPGMPQGRDINEAGPKSVSLVSITDTGEVSVEERPTALAEFARVTVDASGFDEWRDLAESLTTVLTQARQAATARELVVRLTITGATELAWRMRRDTDVLLTEARERGARIGSVWIEKIELNCDRPEMVLSDTANVAPLQEIRRLIDDDILGSDAFETRLSGIAGNLLTQLPNDETLRNRFGTDETDARARLAKLAREGVDDVLSRFHAGPGAQDETG